MDVQARTDGFHVGYVEEGEWMEYTIDIAESAKYKVTAHLASMDGGGKLSLKFGSSSAFSLEVPKTGGWNTFQTVERDINLKAGEQVLRISISALPAFNIDKIVISTKTGIDDAMRSGSKVFSIYKQSVQLENLNNQTGIISFYHPNGQRIVRERIQESVQTFDLKTKGIIFYDICWDNNSRELGKVFIKQ